MTIWKILGGGGGGGGGAAAPIAPAWYAYGIYVHTFIVIIVYTFAPGKILFSIVTNTHNKTKFPKRIRNM